MLNNVNTGASCLELFLQDLFSASDDSELRPSCKEVLWEVLERCCAPGELGVRSGCPGPLPILVIIFSWSHVHCREEVGAGRNAWLQAKASPVSFCPTSPAFFSPSFSTRAEMTRQSGEEQRSLSPVWVLQATSSQGEFAGPRRLVVLV